MKERVTAVSARGNFLGGAESLTWATSTQRHPQPQGNTKVHTVDHSRQFSLLAAVIPTPAEISAARMHAFPVHTVGHARQVFKFEH